MKNTPLWLSLTCLASMAWSLPTQAATAVTSEYTSKPAYYRYTETIRLQNSSSTAVVNLAIHVILLPPSTRYSQVDLVRLTPKPSKTIHDRNGNTIGIFNLARMAPGTTRRITLRYSATSHAIAYRLPQAVARYHVHSALYRLYTSPKFEFRQGVNTDAPPLKALVKRVTRGITNPVLRAKALFSWEVDHIRYRQAGQAAGGAVATLRRRSGICSDFAELYAALLRTDHIPARLIGGYVTNNGGGQAGFHEWDEFYVPEVGWVVADPTWGRFGYFARLQDNWHVPLFGGIVPDVEVAYASRKASASLTVTPTYRFTQQSIQIPSPTSVARPILPVVLPKNTATVHHLATTRGWWQRLLNDLKGLIRRIFHGL